MTSNQPPNKSSYLTDSAVGEVKDDALSFSDFRPALKEILSEAQTPLTVGIFGAWGSGKTSLMRMLRDEIEGEGKPSTRTVWFTAWKYDRHEVLWRALILRVLDALYPREDGDGPREEREVLAEEKRTKNQQEQIELLGQLEESVYQAVEWEEIGPRSIKWWQLLSNVSKAGSEVAATIASGGLYPAFKTMLGGEGLPVEEIEKAAKAISHEVKTRQRRQLFHMEQFEATFKEAVGLLSEKGQKGRLIVFVDDLDRCLPEKAIEVLEAIKLFLEVPDVVFLLGMDREVVQRGIEARYGTFFHEHLGREAELPIRGDTYLQKIVQIPFYLPSLAVADLNRFLTRLDKGLGPASREAFARGLFPNPRQVKRALNIFRLLQQIAREREKRPLDEGGLPLPPKGIAWPLLAKTVVIQSQFPELYTDWRQYPTLVQTLEAEYARRPSKEEEVALGRSQTAPEAMETGEEAPVEKPEESAGGLLGPYLKDRQKYALLERMLSHPAEAEAGEGRERARFDGLSRAQMAAYVRLAGTVETEPEEAPVAELPADLMTLFLGGDRGEIGEAAGRLDEQEAEKDGPQHQVIRANLVQKLQEPGQPKSARISAGNALAQIGDPRFRAVAWYLPDEDLLGFVEIPAGPFLMGSDKDKDPAANEERETPQHQVDLPAYYIARHPVTVAQFRAFVEASGHEPANERSLRGLDNHPVVYVSWHDAMAYCDWLTEQLRGWEGKPEPLATRLRDESQPWRVILPSEAEWEKAARGDDGRIYPWGDKFNSDLANTKEAGVGGTSAVGCFPGGAGPHGLLDMSGNVWEWTRSLFGADFAYPYEAEDGRENLEAPNDVPRVLRGGSFYGEASGCRCSFRRGIIPSSHDWDYRGFRVTASVRP